MSDPRIIEAMKQIIDPLKNWGDPNDVYAASYHPIDDGTLPHVFVQEFSVDDYHPNWGNDIDCSLTIRYAILNRITEEAYEQAWRAMDPDTGMAPLIEATPTGTGYIEEVTVRSSRSTNILDQEKNTRYLAVDFACDALLRDTTT